ncbi:MAG: glycoside-pentoside-hexuronide (GPH):cation symporter [Clostridiales Family XIII bacterium]|jgi:GPH family glycoside/pentoside/hexuronide:cation symporter|nr:glycoside-pentoside-hexuronide (GPH):cation symporter [Clostridiales Family XIII bacterium]
MQSSEKRLSFGTKCGYAAGQVGVSVPYNLVSVFLLFFFTDIAGIKPAFAGTIFMIAVLWAAFADPFIGIFSDNLRTKHGRRRPILLVIGIPYAIVLWLMFTSVDFGSDIAKNIYYVIFAILFFTAMTFTEVPFYSLGAEITKDFNERTKIRSISSFFIYIAVLVAVNLPNFIVTKVTGGGGEPKTGWSMAALACGIIAFIALIICWNATRGRELIVGKQDDEGPKVSGGNIFKEFADVMRVKPVKFVVLANFLYLFGFSTETGVLIYILNYVAHVDPAQQSMVMSVLPIATIAWLPIINLVSVKVGKKRGYTIFVGIIVVALLIFFVAGTYSIVSLCILNAVIALGNGTFWTLCFAMAYDTTEVDEWVNNKRREGVLVAYMSFAQKIGTALATWMIGFVLEAVGYVGNASEQSGEAISGLIGLYTWIPAVLILVSIICVAVYPLTQKKHSALLKAIQQRKAGEAYDTEEFKDLI